MSSQYSFSENDNYKNEGVLDSAVLVEDGVVWDQEEVQVSLNYSVDQDDTLTENHNESYLTANESSNDTHYFSVLETTNETILNNLSEIATDCNEVEASEVPEEQEDPAVSSICTIGGQPAIYGIEGSDELYALEIAYDEEGNLQRFRYRLRINENGEYESVPESIELIPFENEPESEPSQESPAEVLEEEQEGDEPQVQTRVKVFVKQELAHEQETILPDIPDVSNAAEDSSDDLQVNEDEAEVSDEEQTNNHAESKAGILEQSLMSINKVESETFQETFFENPNTDLSPISNHDDHLPPDMVSTLHDGDANSEHFKQISVPDQNPIDNNENATEEDPEQSNFEQILMEETHEHEEESKQIPLAGAKQAEKAFVPESDDNTEDGNESTHSEDSEEHFENSHVDNMSYLEDLNENESDTDDYQIVDGVHVTADTETPDDDSNVLEQFFQREPSLQHQILKIQQQIPVLQSTMNDDKLKEMVNNNFNKVTKGFTYYVVKHPEKENVAAIAHHPVTNKIKTNPRSLLKSSYLYSDKKKEEKTAELKVEKKIVKSKEAMQAKFLHNFIAKTTILHAPIRQQRLPRKQTIKPVVRADEEIIVQEVVVSSNGFIETSEDGVVKSKVPLKPTEIVQLSDSDDDYDPKRENRRKKKQKKRKSKVTEIVISDSEEDLSDDNIVQIDLSADSDDDNIELKDQPPNDVVVNKSRRSTRKSSMASVESKPAEAEQSSDLFKSQSTDAESNFKKKRGRPPKRPNSNTDENTTTDGSTSSSKKQRRNTKDSLESSESSGSKSEEQTESEIQNIKTKWKCTKCPKTFPSQGSLKTHMQYHNFHETNSRNLRQSTNKEESAFKKPQPTNKYECTRCGETFKNNILLTRHVKAHDTGPKSLECSICRKPFADRAQLINHKRTHVKEQMFKTTTFPKHSPKSTTSANSIKSPNKNNLKCNYCTKIFTSLPLLNAHVRTHKRFTCNTCTASFISKLALEDHIRHNCVKQSKSPRRLSLKIRKSFLAPPQRVSKRISLRKSTHNSSASSSSSSVKDKKKVGATLATLQCDSCSMKFISHKALFSHKVVKHGFNTPDKSVLNAKQIKLHKESGKHSSVPAGERLRSAYSSLRTKLDLGLGNYSRWKDNYMGKVVQN